MIAAKNTTKSTAIPARIFQGRRNRYDRREAREMATAVGRAVTGGVAAPPVPDTCVAVGNDFVEGDTGVDAAIGVDVAAGALVGSATTVWGAVACPLVPVGEALGEEVGEGAITVPVRAAPGTKVGCAVAVRVLVAGTEVVVASVLVGVGGWRVGLIRVGVPGPGVGERVGTVWRAGS
jgi:hypothetical protein